MNKDFNLYSYQYNSFSNQAKEEEKLESFLKKFQSFENIHSLEDAKKNLKELFPEWKREVNHINIANTTFVILNRGNLVRISYNSDKEFKTYSYGIESK